MKAFFSFLFIAVFTISVASAQEFSSIDNSVMDAAYYPSRAALRTFADNPEQKAALEPQIRVLYSRPLKKGREIFGELVEFGKPWRIGANESTEILFMHDVKFGGQVVQAGRYSLIAIPTAESWTIKLNTQLDGWGNYSYDSSWDIASVELKVQRSEEVIEALSIVLYEATDNIAYLKIGWDHTYVELPISLK